MSKLTYAINYEGKKNEKRVALARGIYARFDGVSIL